MERREKIEREVLNMREKSFLSILLAIIFILTMAAPAFAAANVQSVTITGNKTVYVGRINSVERKLERLENTWERKYERGKISYSKYRTI